MLLNNLHNLRLDNPKQIIVGQLNINSVRNKFERLTSSIISAKIDVLLLSDTKTNETLSLDQFLILGFTKTIPIRLDGQNQQG